MNNKTILIGIAIFSLLFVGGAYVLLNNSEQAQAKVVTYTSKDKEKPKVEVKETIKDIGNIKLKDESVTEFQFKNTGTKPLQLSNITSSCGCTVGRIVYNGKISKEYGMHSKSDDVVEIQPNSEATLKVIYRPYVMPVYGLVEREVYMDTNDPANAKLSFKIKTIVQK